MRSRVWIVLLAVLLSACGPDEKAGPGPAPDAFFFDSGGEHHIQGHGAWMVTASRDGRFQATHAVQGKETAYAEVELAPPARAILWATIDTAKLDTLVAPGRSGVPDEAVLTMRLRRGTGETIEVGIWQNDARRRLTLQPLLQELKIRIEETYGVKPVF